MRQFIDMTRPIVQEWNDEDDEYEYDYDNDTDFLVEPPHEADTLKPIYPSAAVQIPAFQKWFAGSKVIEDGAPLVVYRGRSKRWTEMPTGHAAALRANLEKDFMSKEFQPEMEFAERLGDVAWFTDDEGIATEYMDGAKEGDVLAAYLNMQNPLILSVEMLGEDEAARRISEILESPQDLKPQWGTAAKALADKIVYDNSVVIQWARKHGHDGLIHDDTCIRGKYTHTSYVAFAPNQIKSIYNTGAFDPSDLNIHR